MNNSSTPALPRSLSPLVIACLAATWLVWGSTYLVGDATMGMTQAVFALVGFAPFFLMATRFIVAGVLLMGWQLGRGATPPTARQWLNALVVGTLMLGGGMGGTAYAEQTIASGLVVAVIAVIPILLVIINLAFGVYPPRSELLAVIVGLAGVVMLTQGAGIHGSPAGLAAIALGTSGGAALLVMSAVRGESWHLPVQPDVWKAWLYLVVFGTLIAFNAYMVLLSRTSTSLAASYSLVNPVVALLLGVTLGGETISAWEWLSAGVVLVGVVILFVSRRG